MILLVEKIPKIHENSFMLLFFWLKKSELMHLNVIRL